MADYKLNYNNSWLSKPSNLPTPSYSGNSNKLSLSSLGNFGTSLLTGGISSLLSGVFGNINYKRQLRMMREQNAFQRQERELQNRWNLEQWLRENEYNLEETFDVLDTVYNIKDLEDGILQNLK